MDGGRLDAAFPLGIAVDSIERVQDAYDGELHLLLLAAHLQARAERFNWAGSEVLTNARSLFRNCRTWHRTIPTCCRLHPTSRLRAERTACVELAQETRCNLRNRRRRTSDHSHQHILTTLRIAPHDATPVSRTCLRALLCALMAWGK